MNPRRRLLALGLVITLAGCAPTPADTEPDIAAEPSSPRAAPPSPKGTTATFPAAAFADISGDPVPQDVATEFQAALRETAGRAGVSATVMSPDGTWSGTAGKADGVRDVRVDDQFAIGSVTKPLIAAQVLQMVEGGELDLDDPATDHLPPDLGFNINGATIRHLLGHRSGIPDYWSELFESLTTHPKRVWKTADMLELVPTKRAIAGDVFEYSNTNYLLLELVIEHVSGRPVVDVLRDGVLSIDGIERLIYQPDEVPSEPMAMPYGQSTAALKKGGGYLPSQASATAGPTTGAVASDSPSLARWWTAFCAGEIVSLASLTEMSTFHDDYGLGLYNVADQYAQAVGHAGEDVGYVAWAGCLPDLGSVIVVLSNRMVNISDISDSLVNALSD
jgi:D-alanyl-D-alanine carboxypeptidase